MDRPIIYDQAQGRDYDVLHGWREALRGLGQAVGDLLGSTATAVAGLAITPTSPASLTLNIAAGDIYQQTAVDSSAYGEIGTDATQTMQQGFAPAQQVTLSTSGLSAGQSRYALIQATFSQTDEIPSDDPNQGIEPYLNASDPSGPPWSGPNNSGQAQNTRRLGVCSINIIYGSVATSGSELPPNPSSGYVPLALVDLAFGQTGVTLSQILPAGPSAGTNVPGNYPSVPNIGGLVQRPIRLLYNGNPNGNLGGIAASAANLATECWDYTNNALYVCTTSGPASVATWKPLVGNVQNYYAADAGSGNSIQITLSPAPTSLAALRGASIVIKKSASATTGAATIAINSLSPVSLLLPNGLALEDGEIQANQMFTVTTDGTSVFLQSPNTFSPRVLSGSGSPQGVQAGTAGSTSNAADLYIDYANNALYICTSTGNAASAVWALSARPQINQQVFTSSGTFTVPAEEVEYEIWGGGGGAGGTLGAGSASSSGAGGEYRYGMATGLTIGGTVAVTVGTGGAGGDGTPHNGTAGGTSSFGSFCSAMGGGGGFGANGAIQTSAPAGGAGGSGGSLTYPGLGGGFGFVVGSALSAAIGGAAFKSPAPSPQVNTIPTAGSAGTYPGAGGNGSTNGASGGNGANGLVILRWVTPK